jgi:hypothetical protein
MESVIFIYLHIPDDGLQTETSSVIIIIDWLLYYIYVPIIDITTVYPLIVVSMALVPVSTWSVLEKRTSCTFGRGEILIKILTYLTSVKRHGWIYGILYGSFLLEVSSAMMEPASTLYSC